MAILGGFPRARLDARHPEAWAICDRCGFAYNHSALRWQYAYRGDMLTNTYLLVCQPCYDEPFQLNRPLLLPPDPEPVKWARPPSWAAQMAGNNPAEGPIQQPIPGDDE